MTILFVALALAMDAFAVSIASGGMARQFRLKHALIVGAWFGAFQALMPFLGWVGGVRLKSFITGADHWVAFGLLMFVGCKMIYEAFKEESARESIDPLAARTLFILAVATSVDALAVGITFALEGVTSILRPVAIIGLVTFSTSFAGVWIGCKGMSFLGRKIEIGGGLILIAIGVKILVGHLLA